jgi:hypothetical protein
VNSQQAYDIAVDITRHVPDETVDAQGRKHKLDPKNVLNGHVGKDGAYFDVVGHDANKQPVIRTAGGHTISVPRTVLNSVIGLKNESYEHAKEEEAAAKKEEEDNKTRGGKVRRLLTVPPESIGGVM